MAAEYATSLNCNICIKLIMDKEESDADPDLKLVGTLRPVSKVCKCNGCNLVHYCGTDHQRLDWSNHREFCRAAQKITSVFQVRHPFLINGQPKSREDFDRTTMQVKFLLCKALNRALSYEEEEFTSFPAHCAICFALRRLRSCECCRAVSYCSEAHAAEDEASHQRICTKLQLHYCPYKLKFPTKDFVKELRMNVPNLRGYDLVRAFEHVTQMRLPVNPTATLANYQYFAAAADFSCMATILYTLTYMQMHEYPNTKFIIHLVGATVEEVLWFAEIHTKFFFLQHPQITRLELYFIGPEVMKTTERTESFEFLGCERTVIYKSYRQLYQNFLQHFDVKPSLIAVFNCGFSEHAHLQDGLNELGTTDEWVDGIVELLYTYEVPIVFTSYTCLEAEFDYAAIRRVAQIDAKMNIQIVRLFNIMQNPYRDLRPLRRWQLDDSEQIYYRNGYAQAVYTKLIS